MVFDFFLTAFVLGLVEGLTEFLPISSTGHLIVAGSLLGYGEEDSKTFDVAIQLGAILAICWEYRARLWHAVRTLRHERASQRLFANLLVAFLPAAVLGACFHNLLKMYLFTPLTVACALIVGALVIFVAERFYKKRQDDVRIRSLDDIGWRDALKIGFAQSFALIPGTSRSGATIIGGMFFGFSRVAATEFSFFLAIPTMFAATAYSLYKGGSAFSAEQWSFLGIGFVTAFISAFFCARWLLYYISRHDFTLFAWYRLAFGLLILVTSHTGIIAW